MTTADENLETEQAQNLSSVTVCENCLDAVSNSNCSVRSPKTIEEHQLDNSKLI